MSPAWARRIFIGITATAGFGGMALVCAPNVERFAAYGQEAAKADQVSTQGAPPSDAFFIDLREGLDVKTEYLSDFDFSADWISMSFRAKNVVFTSEGMRLLAQKPEEAGAPYTTGEFQRRGFYGFGRYEVVMRSSNAPGVVSSFFTHTDSQFGDPHTEIDFEFIGRSPHEVHLNYFVDVQNNPEDVTLWFDPSQGEHLYAFEWSPDHISWYADGVRIREVTSRTSPIGLPTRPSRVIANIWTGNGKSEDWVGTPTFALTSALYTCISHVPAGMKGKQCSDSFKPPGG